MRERRSQQKNFVGFLLPVLSLARPLFEPHALAFRQLLNVVSTILDVKEKVITASVRHDEPIAPIGHTQFDYARRHVCAIVDCSAAGISRRDGLEIGLRPCGGVPACQQTSPKKIANFPEAVSCCETSRD